MELVSIRDVKANTFHKVLTGNTVQEIQRNLSEVVNSPQENQLKLYPEDFDLYHVGSFDDRSGIINSINPPLYICNLTTMVKAGKE